MRKIANETTKNSSTDQNAGLMVVSLSSGALSIEQDAETFADYTQKVIVLNEISLIYFCFSVRRRFNIITGYET
jgi:hypothetical protein